MLKMHTLQPNASTFIQKPKRLSFVHRTNETPVRHFETRIKMENSGLFQVWIGKHLVRFSSGLAYELFTKDPRSMIRAQVGETSTKDMQHEPFGGEVYINPMNAQVGRDVVSIVKR